MKEDKKLDKLIRESLKMEQPSVDFTNKIMNQIEVADAKQEKALGSLLKKNALESPSLNLRKGSWLRLKKHPLRWQMYQL